jgi:hypothetical protein
MFNSLVRMFDNQEGNMMRSRYYDRVLFFVGNIRSSVASADSQKCVVTQKWA